MVTPTTPDGPGRDHGPDDPEAHGDPADPTGDVGPSDPDGPVGPANAAGDVGSAEPGRPDAAGDPASGGPPGEGKAAPSGPPEDFHELQDLGEGDGLVRADVWATAVFTVVAALAVAFPDALVPVFVPLSLLLFLVGCVAYVWAFARGVSRSRYEAVTMGGLFFLTDGVAPARVRRALRGLLAIQVVVAVAAALARPFTPLAFGTLVPILGLGIIALWAARYADFPPKNDDD
jgi:hypothetical protein